MRDTLGSIVEAHRKTEELEALERNYQHGELETKFKEINNTKVNIAIGVITMIEQQNVVQIEKAIEKLQDLQADLEEAISQAKV